MPKSKHRRKGKNRPRAGLPPASSVDPDLADDEWDGATDDPDLAAALAQAEEELAAEIAAADDEDDQEFDTAIAPLIEAVENQLSANDPPEVAATLSRLLAAGHARDEAIALIGSILMFELNEAMQSEREFDSAHYARNLANLPALPDLD